MDALRKFLIPVDALIEGATGLGLILVPSLVATLLFAADLPEIAVVTARVAGIALVSLALCAWLAARSGTRMPALAALLLYNLLVTAYLGWIAVGGIFVGPLLWAVVVVHAVVTVLLVLDALSSRPPDGTREHRHPAG